MAALGDAERQRANPAAVRFRDLRMQRDNIAGFDFSKLPLDAIALVTSRLDGCPDLGEITGAVSNGVDQPHDRRVQFDDTPGCRCPIANVAAQLLLALRPVLANEQVDCGPREQLLLQTRQHAPREPFAGDSRGVVAGARLTMARAAPPAPHDDNVTAPAHAAAQKTGQEVLRPLAVDERSRRAIGTRLLHARAEHLERRAHAPRFDDAGRHGPGWPAIHDFDLEPDLAGRLDDALTEAAMIAGNEYYLTFDPVSGEVRGSGTSPAGTLDPAPLPEGIGVVLVPWASFAAYNAAAPAAAVIDPVREMLTAQVNASAGEMRRLFITDITGQDATYLHKEREARAYLADSQAALLYLADEAAATGQTVAAVANTIVATADQWRPINSRIEAARRGAVVAIGAAGTMGAVAAAAKVDWRSVVAGPRTVPAA